jgi:hypothetical protein
MRKRWYPLEFIFVFLIIFSYSLYYDSQNPFISGCPAEFYGTSVQVNGNGYAFGPPLGQEVQLVVQPGGEATITFTYQSAGNLTRDFTSPPNFTASFPNSWNYLFPIVFPIGGPVNESSSAQSGLSFHLVGLRYDGTHTAIETMTVTVASWAPSRQYFLPVSGTCGQYFMTVGSLPNLYPDWAGLSLVGTLLLDAGVATIVVFLTWLVEPIFRIGQPKGRTASPGESATNPVHGN